MSEPVLRGAFPRELVVASAGSGKTYRLASRIIELLAGGVPSSQILASTFTRKAAGEILDRVLVRLAEAAEDPDKARKLGQDVHERLSDSAECYQLLAGLIADLHQVNIGTLDAFFTRVARMFGQELGLRPRWTHTDVVVQAQIRTEAVLAVLEQADRSEIVEVLRMMNRGAASQRVHDDLIDKVEKILSIQRDVDPTSQDPWNQDLGVTEYLEKAELEKEAKELGERISVFEAPYTQKGEPDKRWLRARDAAVSAVTELDWNTLCGSGIGSKVLNEGGSARYYGHDIPEEFARALKDAFRLARISLAPEFRRESSAIGKLAGHLETAFENAQKRRGAYRFEDITHLLGGPDPTGARGDLHYRLDQQVRHILLDEFQDTSLGQWRALSPVADELLSGHLEERAGVIVADPKQSIYGWRGGRPELPQRVGQHYGLVRDTMTSSWRSSKNVLDFVAKLFRGISSNEVMEEFDGGSAVATSWLKDFSEVTAERELPGYVSVHLAPADSGVRGNNPIQPLLLKQAAEMVRRLHLDMPGRSIGVLVRHNKVLAYLMDELEKLGVPASGEGGTSLAGTPAVNAILGLFKLADHPLSVAARYQVAASPLSDVVDFKDYNDKKSAQVLANTVRRQLVNDGYGATLAEWVRNLAPSCDAREVSRLLQLVNLGHHWDDRPTLRPSDFARYVAREKVQDPSSAIVRVMTVHGAKGLEFDVVVLPELYYTWDIKPSEDVAIPKRNPDTGEVECVYPWIKKELRPLFKDVETAYQIAAAGRLRDELSLLYVATTRARNALHLLVPPEGGRARNSARLVRDALELDDDGARDDDVLYEEGDPRWFEKLDLEVQSKPLKDYGSPIASGPLLKPSEDGPTKHLARRSPSSLEGGDYVDLALRLGFDTGSSLRRGSIVHAWMEHVQWIEDGLPDDQALEAIADLLAPDMQREDLSGLVDDFRKWCRADEIRLALSRDAYTSAAHNDLIVENEMPFVRRTSGEIQQGFIDRLVLVEREGEVISAEVLDFKTDAIEKGDEAGLKERTEYYQPQIDAYRDAVCDQYGLSSSDVSARLVFLVPGVVV